MLAYTLCGELLTSRFQSYPIGTICAIAVAAVYGDKAAKMKATVEAIKTLIADTNTELAADKALAADMHLVDVGAVSLFCWRRLM